MNENLLKAGTLLAGKIQWLLDNNKISEKQIDDYNKIIELIEKGSNENEAFINKLQDDCRSYYLKYIHMEENIKRLEAVCLVHGIVNINALLNYSFLIQWAVDSFRKKTFKVPDIFFEKQNIDSLKEIVDYYYKLHYDTKN